MDKVPSTTAKESKVFPKLSSFVQKTLPQRKRRGPQQTSLPFWLILPTIIVLLIVQVYPAIYTFWLSMQEREPAGWSFVGLKNFERLFDMGQFTESDDHTVMLLDGYVR